MLAIVTHRLSLSFALHPSSSWRASSALLPRLTRRASATHFAGRCWTPPPRRARKSLDVHTMQHTGKQNSQQIKQTINVYGEGGRGVFVSGCARPALAVPRVQPVTRNAFSDGCTLRLVFRFGAFCPTPPQRHLARV